MAIHWSNDWVTGQDNTALEFGSVEGGAVAANALMIMDDGKSIFTPFRDYAYKNEDWFIGANALESYFPF